ncbi:MAG: hydrogen gas-evolving membrane-bound hydrogenase subunit E [Bacillota bacterium]
MKVLAYLLLVAVLWTLILAVGEMPTYGCFNPTHNYVYDRYVRHGVEETGALNVVAQIIVDYRAYDTLIETTVLFAAIVSVMLTLKSSPH